MNRQEWIQTCQHWKEKWPIIRPEGYSDESGLDIYAVVDALNQNQQPGTVWVNDAGHTYYIGSSASKIDPGTRALISFSQADMGWAVPAAIGASFVTDATVICLVGDGSFMSNMQELATAREFNSNVKFVVLNNGGYFSIRRTQSRYYEGRVHGTDDHSGLWFPSFENVARCFDIGFRRIETNEQLKTDFVAELNRPGPGLIECVCTRDQEVQANQALKNGKQAGLHDMEPFLSDEELEKEMIVKI
jgi:acetolactate synthase-1/2/3 large subunit